MNNAIDIKVFGNGMTEIVQEVNGLKKSKVTDISKLANFLSIYSSGFSPLLPTGTLKYGVKDGRLKVLIGFDEVFYLQQYEVCTSEYCAEISMSQFEDIAAEYDEYDREDDDDDDDSYAKRFSLKTYLPKSLWLVDLTQDGDKYVINRGGTRQYYYFDDILMPTTKLYNFPFGNVFDNSELCFGDMDITGNRYKMDDIRGLASISHNWFSAISNTDLYYRLKNHHRCFDFIYKYGEQIHKFDDLNALKADSETYARIRTILENEMKDDGMTFSSLITQRMS